KSTDQTYCESDPIDVTTGRMILTETDVTLPGITLERTHRSDYLWGRSFGPSWASTLDQRIIIDAENARYLAADGSILTYPLVGEGETALPELGRALPLRRLVGGGWLLTDPTSGRVLLFAPAIGPESLLSDVIDGGVRSTVTRNDDGTAVEVKTTAGATVRFVSVQGLLTELLLPDPDGEMNTTYAYTYDQDRALVEVVNSSGDPARFVYTDGRIVRWEDRNDNWYEYTYDQDGRCVRTNGKGGYLDYVFEYSDTRTVVTDSVGAVRTYDLNDRLQVVAESDSLGATTRHEWDQAYRLLSSTDPLGRTTTHEYNAAGLPTTITRPDGSQSRTSYDELGRVTSWTDFDGSTRSREFDTDGRILAETDADGEVVRFERAGRNEQETAIEVGPMIMLRNAAQQITSMTKDGSETHYEYDYLGRIIAVRNDTGTTRAGWTPEGELAWRENPDGGLEEFVYDGEGNLVETIDATGRLTTLEYGMFDLVIAQIDDDDNRTDYAYDTELRLIAVTTPDEETTRYTYDGNGRLAEEKDFEGRTQRYTYDPAGQLIEYTNAAGEVTHYTYDLVGNRIERRIGDAVTRFTYDPAGRVLTATDTNSEIRLERDALGRVISETVNGHTVATSYSDRFGTVTARTRPSGAVTQWSYDESGRPSVLAAGGHHLQFAYDGAREVSRAWDAGTPITPGIRIEQTPGEHSEPGDARYTLDTLGRPITRTDTTGDWQYTWNQQNQLVTVATPNGDHWHYQYDALGRRITKQHRETTGTVREETTFIWSGNLLIEQQHRDHNGNLTTTAWEYHPELAHLVAQVTNNEVQAVLTDDTGIPIDIADIDGTLTGNLNTIPVRAAGRYLDTETGLQYDNSRYYDPTTNRHLSQPHTTAPTN
ncbi:MAG: hypothetical protein QOH73_2773, partial [Gaiellaceae bacterium]|nr:hypothetical protein [Gaiellaceae bacterium]